MATAILQVRYADGLSRTSASEDGEKQINFKDIKQ